MNKEFDRREYNRLCVELLGYVNKTLDDKVFNIHEHPITKHMIETNFTNVFNEDWDWIIKVVKRIYEILGPSDSRKHDIKARVGTLEKEAIVQAIWEFLNWYNKNKNK